MINVITITTNSTIAIGASESFNATGTLQGGSTINLNGNPNITWTSSQAGVANINSSTGIATGISAGQTSISLNLNISGSSSVQIIPATLTVSSATLQSITITPNSSYTMFGAIKQFTATGNYSDGTTQNLTNNIALTWSSSNINVATISSSGIFYPVSIGSVTITASIITSSGTITSNISINVTPNYAYVANNGSATIGEYVIYNGIMQQNTLTPIIATGANPIGLAMDPLESYLFGVNSGPSTITMYVINPATGVLSPNPISSSISVGSSIQALVFEPTGHYAYVTSSGDNNVYMLTFSESTGVLALNPVSSSIASGGQNPRGIAVDPTGKYIYVANNNPVGSGTIASFAINPSNGTLSLLNSLTLSGASAQAQFVTVDPTGRYVFVTNGSAPNNKSICSTG